MPRGRIRTAVRWLGGIFLLLTLIGIGLLAYGWQLLSTPLDPDAERSVLSVARGASLREVRTALVEVGLLGARVPLRAYARCAGVDRAVKSGTYEISAAQTPRAILAMLVEGETRPVAVTIPEGLPMAEIIPRLAAALALPEDSFWQVLADREWLAQFGLSESGAQGYLHPETYHFEEGCDAHTVLAAMIRASEANWTRARQTRADDLGMDRHAILTLAAIIERESAVAHERPRISAVYHNRLRSGRLLQADPTVAYATGRFGEKLWNKHLEVDSPYNTYLHPGLPPGPICAPGLASIDAALAPDPDCRDLYFVARGDGTHAFSRTLDEHNRARLALRNSTN